jgi:hypothetical protein
MAGMTAPPTAALQGLTDAEANPDFSMRAFLAGDKWVGWDQGRGRPRSVL